MSSGFKEGRFGLKIADVIRVQNIDGGNRLAYDEESGKIKLIDRENQILNEIDLPIEHTLIDVDFNKNTGELIFEFEGVDPVRLYIGDVFDKDIYYTKSQVDDLLSFKEDIPIEVVEELKFTINQIKENIVVEPEKTVLEKTTEFKSKVILEETTELNYVVDENSKETVVVNKKYVDSLVENQLGFYYNKQEVDKNIEEAIDNVEIEVDTELSSISENPIANKVVKDAVDILDYKISNIKIPKEYNDTELRNLINGKADSNHTHSTYATKDELDNYSSKKYVESAIQEKINSLDLGLNEPAVKNIVESYNYVEQPAIDNLTNSINKIEYNLICNIEEPTKYTVGNLKEGTPIKGKTITEIITLMLFGEDYEEIRNPNIVEPKISSIIIDKDVAISGNSFNTDIHVTFDRGSIEPSFGTTGYRAGECKSISLEGATFTIKDVDYEAGTATISMGIEKVNPGDNTVIIKIEFNDGEQPLNNKLEPVEGYGPFTGSINGEAIIKGITTVSVGGVETESTDYSLIMIEDDEDIVSSGWFEDADGSGYQVVIPEDIRHASREDYLSIMVPTSMNIVGVKYYDIFYGSYMWYYGSKEKSLEYFTLESNQLGKPITYNKVIEGINVNYYKYIGNNLYGSIQLRIYME